MVLVSMNYYGGGSRESWKQAGVRELLVIGRLFLLQKRPTYEMIHRHRSKWRSPTVSIQVGRQLPVHITHFNGAVGAHQSSKSNVLRSKIHCKLIPMIKIHVGSVNSKNRSKHNQPGIGPQLHIAKSDHRYDTTPNL